MKTPLKDFVGDPSPPMSEDAKKRWEERAKQLEAERIKAEDALYELLDSPDLLDRICIEFDKIIPNMHEQKKLLILSIASQFVVNCDERLHVLINSDASAGKSFFMKSFSKLLPEEKRIYFTRLSPKALAYLHPQDKEPDWSWNGKHLFLEDVTQELLDSDVFKVFASEGAKTAIVDHGKAKEITIVGTPTIILTTAESRPKSEILNRFMLLNLDETPKQTRAIFQAIARKEKINPIIFKIFENRAFKYIEIPYLDRISDKFPAELVRSRRDFHRFLALIRASTFVHQHQREIGPDGEIMANRADFEIAMKLFSYVNPSSFLIDLTHIQRKAYDDLIKLWDKCKNVEGAHQSPLGTNFDFYDVESKKGEKVAQTCECGSAHFTRTCIYSHYPNRILRKWDLILERLAEKDVINIKTMINPKTKREVTCYFPKTIDIIGTFNIFSDTTNDDISLYNKSAHGKCPFLENSDVKNVKEHDGALSKDNSTIQDSIIIDTESVKPFKKAKEGDSP